MTKEPDTFNDCISQDYHDLWASGQLVPLTAKVERGCVVVTEWAGNRYTLSLAFWSFALLLIAVMFVASGWVWGLFAFISIVPVYACFAGFHLLLWSGTLCIIGKNSTLDVSFPRHKLEIQCEEVSGVATHWVRATKNHVGRRMGAVVIQAIASGESVSIPVFLSYNKRECRNAQALVIDLLGMKMQVPD